MKITSGFFGALMIIIAGLLISLSVFSFTKAERSERQANVRAMCTNEMFCWLPVFNQAPSSRRAVTVPCFAASGSQGFDTPDGLLHIGDYYFEASNNKYVAYMGAGITSTSTAESPHCVGPHYIESLVKPVGMREVHRVGNRYYQHCMLDGREIAVIISAEDFLEPGTPRRVNPNQQVNCIYAAQVQNPSPERR